MPALSCLRCSACFLDAVGARGWRDGCGAQVARCIGVGSTRAAGRARSTAHPDRNGRRGGWRRAVGAMRTAKRNTCKTAAAHDGRDGGAMSAESARWRHRGMRMAARSGVDAMRATARDGRDADEASLMGAGGGKQNWGAALAAHGCRMRAMAHFWRSGKVAVGDGCCEGGCAGKGK